MDPCIQVSDLRKSYGHVNAVDGVSFDVEYGKVFGFLGPNGAGKTTTIRVLTTLIHPTSGTVKTFGKEIVKHQREIKKRIGVVLQEPSFEANLTVDRALELYGLLWGVPGEKTWDRAREPMESSTSLPKGRKNDELSIGREGACRWRANHARHGPALPRRADDGTRPSARRILLDYVKKHVKDGLTVFLLPTSWTKRNTLRDNCDYQPG